MHRFKECAPVHNQLHSLLYTPSGSLLLHELLLEKFTLCHILLLAYTHQICYFTTSKRKLTHLIPISAPLRTILDCVLLYKHLKSFI